MKSLSSIYLHLTSLDFVLFLFSILDWFSLYNWFFKSFFIHYKPVMRIRIRFVLVSRFRVGNQPKILENFHKNQSKSWEYHTFFSKISNVRLTYINIYSISKWNGTATLLLTHTCWLVNFFYTVSALLLLSVGYPAFFDLRPDIRFHLPDIRFHLPDIR